MILYQNEHVKTFVLKEHRCKTEAALKCYQEMDKAIVTEDKCEVFIRIEEGKEDAFYIAIVSLFSDIIFVHNMKRIKTENFNNN